MTAGGQAQAFHDFQVDPSDLHERRTAEQPRRALEVGQVRFRIDSFAFTANNVSYASSGSFLGYLDFFPAHIDAPWRRIPVMGHGEVIESSHPGIDAGGRYFGFYPMSGEHVINADRRGSSIWDAGSHREGHAETYRRFEDVHTDAHYDPAREDVVALLRGLFVTSFLVDDYLQDNDDFAAQSVIVTSASSKTSIALGYCLQKRAMPSVGLTSGRHVDAMRRIGCYDTVLAYEDALSLDAHLPTVLVDLAGKGELLWTIHSHFGDALRYSCAVGATHPNAGARPAELPGPAPKFFFAPGQIKKRSTEWGATELTGRLGRAFAEFASYADGWLDVVKAAGSAAVDSAYIEVLEGRSSPTTGLIVSMWEK